MPDLDKFDSTSAADKGAVLQLTDPSTGELWFDEKTNEPVTITLRGRDGKVFQKLQRQQLDVRTNNSLLKGKKIKQDDVMQDTVELMVACTVSWQHIIEGGKELPCTQQNAEHLYNTYPWILEQVSAFINDRKNFLGN